MYKVFINNKALTFGSTKGNAAKNIPYMNGADLDVAIDLLNHSAENVHIYSNHIEKVWAKFQDKFKKIHAAGGIVLNTDNQLLWIYRLGMWDLPKGKMEKGEDQETTALREVEEECGITGLKINHKVADTFHIYYHKEYILKITHWFEMEYHKDEKLVPQTEEGITRVKWFDKKDLNEPISNTYGNIKDLIMPYLD
ncbi:NUDIX domain-containing protein [Flavobacteriaceae bacterium Ap0902]|nr:NUDIX domain-containing protein [Flavobacteriaceae bacterium Ap0902]